MKTKKSVGKQGINGAYREPLSIWNVFIPSDEDRDAYIANCVRTNTISVINDNAEVNHKVKIGTLALQAIKFPQNQNELGSPLLLGNILSKSQVVVIDVFEYEDDYNELLEHESALIEKTDTGSAEVRAQGKDGTIYIHVDSSNANGGKVIINVTNSEASGELQVNVDGSIGVNASGLIQATSNSQIQATVNEGVNDLRTADLSMTQGSLSFKLSEVDENGNETLDYDLVQDHTNSVETFYDKDGVAETTITKNNTKVIVNGKDAVVFGAGAEPILLGDTSVEKIEEIIDQVDAIAQANAQETHPSAMGPTGPPVNAADYVSVSTELASIKVTLKEMKSTYSSTD